MTLARGINTKGLLLFFLSCRKAPPPAAVDLAHFTNCAAMTASTEATTAEPTESVKTIPDEEEQAQQEKGKTPHEDSSKHNGTDHKATQAHPAVTTDVLRDHGGYRRAKTATARYATAADVAHYQDEIADVRRVLAYGPDPIKSSSADVVATEATSGVAPSGPLRPSGPLGELLIEEDFTSLHTELANWEKKVELAVMKALEHIMLHSQAGLIDFSTKRFTSLEAFNEIYKASELQELLSGANDGQWPFKGYLEKGACDELFGYERLTIQPYSIARLPLTASPFPFEVPDATVRRVTSGRFGSLRKLNDRRRLLYVDYRCLQGLQRFEGRYSGACEAYFWQKPCEGRGASESDDMLLPLAIRIHPLKGEIVPIPPPVRDSDTQENGLLATLRAALSKFIFDTEVKIKEELQNIEDKTHGDSEAVDKDKATKTTSPTTAAETLLGSQALLYTPLDPTAAWTLAKMVFSQNDLVWSSFYHLASTHYVIEIVHLVACRTLHKEHPVFALMARFSREAFGVQRVFTERLINRGGPIDQLLP